MASLAQAFYAWDEGTTVPFFPACRFQAAGFLDLRRYSPTLRPRERDPKEKEITAFRSAGVNAWAREK